MRTGLKASYFLFLFFGNSSRNLLILPVLFLTPDFFGEKLSTRL